MPSLQNVRSQITQRGAWLGALALAMALPLPRAQAQVAGTAAEPVRYVGTAGVNRDRHDGALPLIVGTHSYQVLRANRTNTNEGNGVNWTYNHAPNMAYWNGRFYMEFAAGPINETDFPPTNAPNRFLATSTDGRTWQKPVASFPFVPVGGITGVSGITSTTKSNIQSRGAFYIASNGKLLMTTSVGTDAPKAVGRLVREVLNTVPATFGPTYFIRYYAHSGFNATNTASTGIPFYTTSSDTAFKAACAELLAQSLVTENWWEDEINSQGNDATTRPSDNFYKIPYAQSETGDAFTKAHWAFQRADGNWVAGWKYGLFAVYNTAGNTWSAPRLARTIATSAAKSWGQKMPNNRYALAYNPTTDNLRRWPLALITSNDGITFDNMGIVVGDVPPMRFKGTSKESGPQYVRGVESWSGQPESNGIWLGYSMNKEDMWVSRVPVDAVTRVTAAVSDNFDGITAGAVVIPNWNIYSPVWAPVDVVSFESSNRLRLQDRDPYDYAKAVRVIPESGAVTVSFQVRPSQTNGQLDIDLMTPNGFRPVRLSFGTDGQFKANNGATMSNLGAYAANTWITVTITANCAAGTYNVTAGSLSGSGRAFAESATSIGRIEMRTGDFRTTPNTTTPVYTTADLAGADTAGTNRTFHIDNVTTADTTGPRVLQAFSDGKNAYTLVFDEPVSSATATVAANYVLSPALAVNSAQLQDDQRTVRLTLAGDVTAGTAYSVTVSNVRDLFNNLVQSGSAPSFTVPTTPPTSNLRMWVRADTGVTQSSGFVSTWADQSGVGNSLTNTASGTGSKPQLVSNILNGKPVVRFDGSDYLSRAVTGLIADKAGIFIVFKANKPASGQFVFDTAVDGQLSRHQLVQNADTLELKVDGNGLAINNDSYSANQFILASYVMAGSASYSKINAANFRAGGFSEFANGSYSQIPANSGSPFVLGARHTLNQAFYNGDIAEVIIYNQVPTAAQLQQVEAYLMNKYFAQPGQPAQVAAPTFSPGAGGYGSAQNVTISTTTSGATIRYTTNGTDPTSTTGTVYSGPVTISATSTLKAIAYKSGMTDSTVSSAAYTIGGGGGSIPANIRIMPVGDSITAGAGVTDGGYRSRLQTLLTAGGYTFDFVGSQTGSSGSMTDPQHEGYGGAKSNEISANIQPNLSANNAQLYLIHVGTNDISNTEATLVNSRLRTMLDNIYAATPNAHVILAKIISRSDNGRAADYVTVRSYIEPIVADYTAAGRSISWVNQDTLVSSDFPSGDVFHPNASGYQKMAQTWYNGILAAYNAVATPTFSPAPGTYSSTQNVTISTSTSGATIRYTTNGTDPTPTTGTVYSGPVAISTTTTLKAIAYKSGMTNSTVNTGVYTINTGGGGGETPVFTSGFNGDTTGGSPAGWTVSTSANTTATVQEFPSASDKSLRLVDNSATGLASVTRTFPNETGEVNFYVSFNQTANGAAIQLGSASTDAVELQTAGGQLQYFSGGSWTNVMAVANNTWISLKIVASAATDAFAIYNWEGGSWVAKVTNIPFKAAQTELNRVRLFTSYAGTGFTVYYDNVEITTGAALPTVATPTFSPAAGTYTSTQNVTISSATGGATIRYTTNGTDPTSTTGTVYSGPVTVSASTTLKAIAYAAGSNDSAVATAAYVINTGGSQSPFGGTAWALPATTVQFEDYDVGGQGVAFNDTTTGNSGSAYRTATGDDVDIETTGDTGGGHNVGWIATGEWLEYTVNVATAGTYTLEARVASSGGGGAIRFEFDGVDKTGTMTAPDTGGWQTYQTITKTGVSLSAGQQVVRVFVVTSGVNLNWFRLLSETSGATTALNDSFADGGRTDGADPLDGNWYLLANATPTSSGVTGGALVLGTTNTSAVGTNPHAITTFAPQTLATGQKITLSFSFSSSGAASATGLRFGIYNSGGTNLTGDLYANPPATGTIFQNDVGYSVFAPHQGTQAITLYSRPANTTANTVQLAAAANTTVIGSAAATTATNTTSTYTASLELERTATGYNYTVTYAGTTFSGSTTNVTTSTFDTLAIFAIEGPNAFLTLDNVVVSVDAAGAANQAPIAVNDSASTNEETLVNVNVVANDSDPDSGPSALSLQNVGAAANGGTQIASGQARYTPNAGFVGSDSFSYTITDGAATATATVNVTVNSTALANNLTGTTANLTGTNVGASSAGSSRVLASGNWEVNGSGTGLAATADSFRFESKAITGDFEVFARVNSLTSSGAQPLAGLMVREGTAAGARSVALATTTGTTSTAYRSVIRSATDGSSTVTTLGANYTYANGWVGIVRTGNNLELFTSADGQTWTSRGVTTLASLGATVQVGVFSSSGTSGANARAVITNYELVQAGGSETTLWESTFNGDTTGGSPASWTLSTAANTTATVQEFPSVSDKSLRLVDSNNLGLASATRTFTDQSGTVNLYVSINQTANGTALQLGSASTDAVELQTAGGQLQYFSGGAWTNVMAIANNTWYSLRITADPATDTFSIASFEGGAWVTKVSNIAFKATQTVLNRVRLFSSYPGTGFTSYYDNVKVATPN